MLYYNNLQNMRHTDDNNNNNIEPQEKKTGAAGYIGEFKITKLGLRRPSARECTIYTWHTKFMPLLECNDVACP